MMKKAGYITVLAALALLGGCNNFFHELVPPDDNRILSFAVLNQQGEARIEENSLSALVERETDLAALIPEITVSAKAALLPLTLPYVAAAFPSVDIVRAAIGIYSADDLSAYVIGLIKENPGFNVPALSEPIDFSGPVDFLVIGGLGGIRRYTARVSVDTGTAQILSFGFSKYDNPLLMGDALGMVDEAAKTVMFYAVFPVEMEPSYSLVPGFELLGDGLEADGLVVRPGIDALAFAASLNNPPPPLPQTKTLTVHRAGYPSSEYTLTLMTVEDPDTIRSITDFRFTKTDNPGVAATAVASIINSGDQGTIRIQALYRGAKPTVLKARYVSPGTVTVGGVSQATGTTANDFSGPLEYRVVSRNGLYTRTYRVETEFINIADLAPRLLSFRFPADLNGELAQTAVGEIDDGAGRVLVDVKYTGASAPRSLTPEFSASGLVKVSGLTQTSGAGGQDFTRQVKYTVVSPEDPALYRDYWVQTAFTRDTSGDASITAFSFHPDENPQLADEVSARIDQITGQIYAYLPFGADISSTPLVPRFTSYGKVRVEGLMQTSGSGGHIFDQPVVYSVESANGLNLKTYTVTVQELNTRLYVDKDASGNNNGAGWADAFISLKAACETAALFPDAVPREIWIAAGTYTPSFAGDVTEYFPITPNTSYIGGFGGWETAKSQRNPAANPVIISGELAGGGRSRHLFYNPSAVSGELVFEDLRFTKADTLTGTGREYSGAAINAAAAGGTLRVANCAFTELEAGHQGGAVYAEDMAVDISGSRFEQCGVPQTSGRSGGAVYSGGGAVNITDVSFTSTSAYYGGALHAAPAAGQALTMSEISLDNVVSAMSYPQNGGIYIAGGGNNTVTITDIKINKTSSVSGNTHSGIYIEAPGGTVDISGGELYNAGMYINNGSGMTYLENITISNAQSFANDPVWIAGGADISTLAVSGTWPASTGTAVYITSSSRPVNVSGLTVNDIKNGKGLYIYNSSAEPTVIDGLNISETQSSYGGGAYIYVHGSLSITNAAISETQGSYGGGMYIENNSAYSTVIDGLNISNTTSSSSGGGAYIYVDGSLSITDMDISDTTSGSDGGGAYISVRGSLSITIADISETKSSNYGGGMYIFNMSAVPSVISGLNISNTTSSSSGGGAFISVRGSLSITNADISETQSSNYGGGMYIYNISAEPTVIDGLNISNTTSSSSGGGAYIYVDGSLSITDASIRNSKTANSASGTIAHGGGGIYIGRGEAMLTDVEFINTAAVGSADYTLGGAVLFSSNTQLTMTNCSILNAASSKSGGAISGLGPSSSCVLNGVSFTNCVSALDRGHILYGNKYNDINGAPAYTVKPGCSVNGTVITGSNYTTVLSSPNAVLYNGATITFSP
jgi:hypothetical protein